MASQYGIGEVLVCVKTMCNNEIGIIGKNVRNKNKIKRVSSFKFFIIIINQL